jgi:hypothetical protein|tara:strand:+ start:93 stop:197 length:105 start_codon:yes stop_codon:yes gene_type:complete
MVIAYLGEPLAILVVFNIQAEDIREMAAAFRARR